MFDPVALDKLIRESGLPFRENGRSFLFTCPRCLKNKLSMFKDSGNFICYHCQSDGFKGRPEYALTELLNRPLPEIRKFLYGTDGVGPSSTKLDLQLEDFWGEDAETFTTAAPEPEPQETVFPFDFVNVSDGKNFLKAARYLNSRGVTLEHCQAYDIHWSPVEQRVIFPVKVEGKLIGWQARYVGATEVYDEETHKTRRIPKILTSKSLQTQGGRYLMFQDRLKGSEHCVLAEGPVSAIKAHRCGGNVASMGKTVTDRQLAIIRSRVRKLYLALDPDAAEEINKLIWDASTDMEVYVMTPPQNKNWTEDPKNEKDLGDLTEDEVYDAFRQAKPVKRGTCYISLGSLLLP